MWTTLEQILQRALDTLYLTLQAWLPPLLAGAVILFCAWLIAVLVRWSLNHLIKGISADRFLRQTGIISLIDRGGRLRTTQLVSNGAYWIILGIGALTALNAFNTSITSRIVDWAVFLFPKLVATGLILLAGAWIGQYLGRSVLLWAVNEGVSSGRMIAAAVRVVIQFISVVVAADYLDFARSVFLSAFIILVGGAALAASLAAGLGARNLLDQRLRKSDVEVQKENGEKTYWQHL